MNRRITSSLAGAALAAALLASPGTAFAHDAQGLGIGANLTLGSSIARTIATGAGGGVPLNVGGIALDYWASPDMLLEFMLGVGFGLVDPPGMAGGDSVFSLGGSVGFFGVLADGGQTNLMLGGRLGVVAVINYTGLPDADDNQAAVHIDIPIRVEHWVDDHFSINCQVGVALVIVPDTTVPFGGGIGATSGFFGGAGFTYYLDGPVGGSSSPPPRRPAPAPTPTTTEEPDQESGAGW